MSPHTRAHLSKYIVALSLVIVAVFAVGCAVTEENVRTDQAPTLQAIKGRIADAQAKGDELAAKAAQEELDAFEAEVMRERGGPIIGAVSAVAPALTPFAPLATLLLPLFGKRGWQNAKRGVQRMTKGDVAGAAMSALAYAGIAHSTPESAAAAKNSASGAPVPLPSSPSGA